MRRYVLFIHGAGTGAYSADRLLADSLQAALGDGFRVDCPKMPDEENAPYRKWKAEIRSRLARAKDAPILVGHSIGGSVLLKFLCERRSPARIAGLFVLATPFWGADDFWKWDEVRLPADAKTKLAGRWPLVFYHSRDDEVVPFAHMTLYAKLLPRGIFRKSASRGHQFGNDLTRVAADIRRLATKAR